LPAHSFFTVDLAPMMSTGFSFRFPSLRSPATVLVVVLVWAAAAPPAMAQEAYDLRLALEEGESYHFTMQNDRRFEQQVMGRQVSVSTDQTITHRYDVTDVATDGTMTLDVTYERVQMEQDSPAGSFSYDSAEEEASVPQGAKSVAAFVEKSIQMKLAPDGDAVSVEGTEAVIDSAMEESSMSPAAREQMKKQFGVEGMKDLMDAGFSYLGAEGVQVGDTWERTADLSRSFPMKIDMTYTLERVEEGEAVLGVTADIATPEDAEPTKMGGNEVKMTFSGTQQGTMRIDLGTGLPVESQIEQNMDGSGEVRAQGQTITMKMNVSGTVSRSATPVE
jgi:hypothetical protein